MSNYLCPYCLTSLNEEDTRKEKMRDTIRGGGGFYVHQCTNEHCHSKRQGEWLPSDIFERDTKIISLAGGRDSGKSNFITALAYVLMGENDVHANLRVAGVPLEVSNKTIEKYYNQLYINKKPIEQTNVDDPSQWEPIVLSVSLANKAQAYMSLFDTAGEEFRREQDLLAKHPNIGKSNGIILLIDPLQSETGYRYARRLGLPVTPPSMFPETVIQNLGNVIKTEQEIHNATSGHSMYNRWATKVANVFQNNNFPSIAICVAKYDLISKYGIIDINSDYAFDPMDIYLHHENKVDWEKINQASNDIERVLNRNFAALYGSIQTNFEGMDYKFFGVSSFEMNSDFTEITKNEPKGVLTPLLWLLKQMKLYKM